MEEPKYFIDTNIFLRLIVADQEKQHKDCVAFFERVHAKQQKLFTSSLVLAEINWTLCSFYQYDKKQVLQGLRAITSASYLKLTDESNIEIALDYYEHFSVKYIDAVIGSHPEIFTGRMSVVSYDKDFDKMNLRRKEPMDLI